MKKGDKVRLKDGLAVSQLRKAVEGKIVTVLEFYEPNSILIETTPYGEVLFLADSFEVVESMPPDKVSIHFDEESGEFAVGETDFCIQLEFPITDPEKFVKIVNKLRKDKPTRFYQENFDDCI